MTMHLAINGYFFDQPTTGTGQYTRQLLRELQEHWPHRLSVLLPPTFNSAQMPAISAHTEVHVLSTPFGGKLGKVWFLLHGWNLKI